MISCVWAENCAFRQRQGEILRKVRENVKSTKKTGMFRLHIRIKKSLFPAVALFCALTLSSCSNRADQAALREQAITRFQEGDYAGAEDLLNQALLVRKGEVSEMQFDLLQYRGECELRQGEYAKAKETYDALLASDKREAYQQKYAAITSDLANVDKIQAGLTSLSEKDYETAYAAFDQYAALDGTLIGKIAWYNKAVCAEYQQKFDEAYELFHQYLKQYPEDEAAAKELAFLKTR